MGWGTVKVDDIAEGTVDTRFAKFVEQIVARKIVPLLGSGVSYGHAPNVGQLLERTRELIPPPFDPALATGSDFAFVCEMIYAKHGNAVLLCEALKIQELADPALPLTAAHLYIALLAYEGFIDLAITTNYDCGLDRAYRQLSKHRDGEEWLPITFVRKTAATVFSCSRSMAARSTTRNPYRLKIIMKSRRRQKIFYLLISK
jgi:hypothetical protein